MKQSCLHTDKYLDFNYMHYNKNDRVNDAMITLAVKVGSVNDGDRKGIAHFLEHMLILSLANASQIAPDQFRIKGTTDFDKTLYEITCSDKAEDIGQAIKLLLEIHSGRLLKKRDMEEARRDIDEEFDHFNDDSQSSLFRILIDNSEFLNSIPIGFRDGLKDISFQELQAFHQRNYRKTNAHILIVSRSDEEIIRQYFRYSVETISTIGQCQLVTGEEEDYVFTATTNKYLLKTEDATRCSLFVHDAPAVSTGRSQDRVIKDVALVVLDYCLREILSTDDIYISKLRYSEFYKYLCISIHIPAGKTCCLYENPNPLSQCISREIKSLMQNIGLLQEIMKTYINQIIKSPLTQELAMKELLSYALYGEPVYAQQEYCSILNKVTYEQVLEQLSVWFDKGEELSIVVDKNWRDRGVLKNLG
ncbi:insulinase family protein [Paenibacillus rhizoplanae]|uniref:Insulinase family protein n=2 Tax=Paenibacillus rhizoplanae TaxID=1917181 RepID=A0ABW5FES5_9BACL